MTTYSSNVSCAFNPSINNVLTILDGFLLSENKDDSTKLDHLILPQLTKSQTTLLQRNNYLGDYTLDAKGVCYRTQVALRSTFTSVKKMEQFLAGEWDGEKDDATVEAKRNGILEKFQDEIEVKLADFADMEDSAIVKTLVTRWEQIFAMIESVLEQ